MSSGRKEQVRKYKEYGVLRYKGEKEQRILWTKRNRWENTKSMVIWEKGVRENKEYYELRGTGEKIQRVNGDLREKSER
jgi:hypothetical protein